VIAAAYRDFCLAKAIDAYRYSKRIWGS
jgi:hypothetical protein